MSDASHKLCTLCSILSCEHQYVGLELRLFIIGKIGVFVPEFVHMLYLINVWVLKGKPSRLLKRRLASSGWKRFVTR